MNTVCVKTEPTYLAAITKPLTCILRLLINPKASQLKYYT